MEFYMIDPSYQQIEPDPIWDEEGVPESDNVQDVVRQSMLELRAGYRHTPSSRAARPIRRRLHPESVKSHQQTFVMGTVSATEWSAVLDNPGSSTSSSPMTIVTASTPSANTPWSVPGRIEEIFDEDADADADVDAEWASGCHYGQEEVEPVQCKIEPLESMDVDHQDAPSVLNQEPLPATPSQVKPKKPGKRPRGRPRKYPKPDPELTKVTKRARVKTGCDSCRHRKKKCDEVKPICTGCVRNGIQCKFPGLRAFETGEEKRSEGLKGKSLDKDASKSAIVPRIETSVSMRQNTTAAASPELSRQRTSASIPYPLPSVLTGVETDCDRMLFRHYCDRLCFLLTVERGKETAFRDLILPAAINDKGLMHSILSLSSNHLDYSSDWGVQLRRDYPGVTITELQARSTFHSAEAWLTLKKKSNCLDRASNLTSAKLQVIFGILGTLNDPTLSGQHRNFLAASHKLASIYSETPENSELKDLIDEFSGYHILADQFICLPEATTSYLDNWEPPEIPMSSGIVRLLGIGDRLFTELSKITRIRNRIRANLRNNGKSIFDYRDLSEAIDIEATIHKWEPAWPAGDHQRDIVGNLYKHMTWVYLFRTMSPPQSTQWVPNPKLIQAVDEGLSYLATIEPNSGFQTVLLMPTFMIGCAAFEERQRQKVREAIRVIKSYMGFRNTESTLTVLEEVWRLMDARDIRSWDWQYVAHHMDMDFLAT